MLVSDINNDRYTNLQNDRDLSIYRSSLNRVGCRDKSVFERVVRIEYSEDSYKDRVSFSNSASRCGVTDAANSLVVTFLLVSSQTVVMLTPWMPQGVMWLKPVSDWGVMLMAKPCMEIHFLTPTPMDASFFSPAQTPVRPSFVLASTP